MILLTGGAGYIGSHTCVELLEANYEIVIADNLSNSDIESINRIEKITGKRPVFYELDLLDQEKLNRVFEENQIEAVIHFGGLKAVGESVEEPLQYYQNNLTGTLNLLEVMKNHGVKNLVFSSSATVYGEPASVPIRESFPLSATNPYGRTKLMIEEILTDIAKANSEWSISMLRYFNPVGAHVSGLIGEDPSGIPNNLFPFITQVAIGARSMLNIFGDDYPTIDGTGVRDYIHVMDLASGHLKALEKNLYSTGIDAYNLGTGIGYSVLQMVRAFEEVNHVKIPYRVTARRPGDIAECYADARKANKELNWYASRGLNNMCSDAWNWQVKNPSGYKTKVYS
ncbi:UDP-glucose 4-epimerase GalE [Metabacillus sp. KIGAM252]|uniref:UDP-glucose 4-epimerase n=1 Tax=Metabacillus flavus TaxID=2823519 RepID=A0ABS5LG01_9BACI|nr:UDP-glucose 4-epimerase GalE [Metabacillus flavus]